MFTEIQIHDDQGMVTCGVLKMQILNQLPYRIVEQMHSTNNMGKGDLQITAIITLAGRTAEKLDEVRNSLGLKKNLLERLTRQDKPFQQNFQRRNDLQNGDSFQKHCPNSRRIEMMVSIKHQSGKIYAEQTDHINQFMSDSTKAVGECNRCAWFGDKRRAPRTMNCCCSKWVEKGTVPFPIAREFQMLKVGAHDRDKDYKIDLYGTVDEEYKEAMDGKDEE